MATFQGDAWIDVVDRAGVDLVLSTIDDEALWKVPETVHASAYETADGWRIEAHSHDTRYDRMPDLVAEVMRRTGVVPRAFIALDHDEFGAEHIVLAMGDGRVGRVHHRYIYPRRFLTTYREGTPWVTGLPTIEPVRGRRSGRLVDGPRARAALAEIYRVPPREIRRAARRARHAHRELGEILAPFTPWLDALGLTRTGPGVEPVLVRGRPVWQEAFKRYAVPELPGDWRVTDDVALLTPVDLIVRGIRNEVIGLAPVLHPLYAPLDDRYLTFPRDNEGPRWGYWDRVEQAETYMRDAVAVLRADLLPMLYGSGSPEGFRRFCAEQAAQSGNHRLLYLAAATDIVLERYDDAETVLSRARAANRAALAHVDPDPWDPGPPTPDTRAVLLARAAAHPLRNG